MFATSQQETTSQRIEKLIREVLPWQYAKTEVKSEHDLQGDLGIDSLGKVALGFRIEQEFGLDFNNYQGDLTLIRTVADVVEAVDSLRIAGGVQ